MEFAPERKRDTPFKPETNADSDQYRSNKSYAEEVNTQIATYLRNDWFEYAQELAGNAGITDADFARMADINRPNGI